MSKLEKTVLKKAGIIVAVAAAGALAVAPLAFAGEPTHAAASPSSSSTCTFANGVDNSGNRQAASGVTSLLGLAGTAANANAPVTPQTNAPALSCNNVKDVFNLNSKNSTKDINNSKTVDNSKTVNKTSSSTLFSSFTGLLGL